MSSAALLDRNVALARVGGDTELLAEIADLFLTEYPTQLAALASAVEAGNAHAIERAAHSIKGSVSTFGAQPAVQVALAIEQAGRASDLTSVPQLLADLQSRLQALHSELANL